MVIVELVLLMISDMLSILRGGGLLWGLLLPGRQAVMELPATKRAYELTLAETLDVANEDLET